MWMKRDDRERTALEAKVWEIVDRNRAEQRQGPRTVSDVARTLGVRPHSLHAYLAGLRAVRPAAEMRGSVTLEALAAALGVEPGELPLAAEAPEAVAKSAANPRGSQQSEGL